MVSTETGRLDPVRTLITIAALMLALTAGIGLWVTDSMAPSDAQGDPVVGNTARPTEDPVPDAGEGSGDSSLDPSDPDDPARPDGQSEQPRPEFDVERRAPADSHGGGGGSGSGGGGSGGGGGGSAPREVAPAPQAPGGGGGDWDDDDDDDWDDDDDDDGDDDD